MEKEKEVASNNDMRFMMDLEFVELLSNPFYLQNLAQSRVFDDQAFLNYVDYLQYWKEATYLRFIKHPHALYFLGMLQTPEFRRLLLDARYIHALHNQLELHWRSFRLKRFREWEQIQECVGQVCAEAFASSQKT